MTLPKDVAEADEALVVAGGDAIWQYYPVIRAHLLSQDASINNLRSAAQKAVLANADLRAQAAAADALLMDCRKAFAAMGVMQSHVDRIDAQLSENTHG